MVRPFFSIRTRAPYGVPVFYPQPHHDTGDTRKVQIQASLMFILVRPLWVSMHLYGCVVFFEDRLQNGWCAFRFPSTQTNINGAKKRKTRMYLWHSSLLTLKSHRGVPMLPSKCYCKHSANKPTNHQNGWTTGSFWKSEQFEVKAPGWHAQENHHTSQF